MPLYQERAKIIQDHVHLGSAVTALTTPMKVRAFTVVPTGTQGTGTQVVAGSSGGSGYSTGGTAMTWNAATTANPSVSTNQAASWVGWPRTETVVAIDVCDSAGTPIGTEYGNLNSSKAMNAGDTLSLAAAAVSSSLS